MSFSEKFERVFRNVLPSPFSLAVILSVLVLACALIFFKPASFSSGTHFTNVLQYWYEGIWSAPLLVFGYQMILILVLGHALALSRPANIAIKALTKYCNTTPKAALIVSAVCVFLGLINWGLALIFGAILARKVAEYSVEKGYAINYPLIAASGYTGLMVWHGGISGSSLLKVAEPGHLNELTSNSAFFAGMELPEFIGFSDTVFSEMNIAVSLALLVIIPFGAYALGKNSPSTHNILRKFKLDEDDENQAPGWAERFDSRLAPALILGFLVLLTDTIIATSSIRSGENDFMSPNFINMALLGLGLIAHGSLSRFAWAIRQAIPGASGILIQFPLYFGILGVMQNTGMVSAISNLVASISGPNTFFVNTFFSAGFVNILVPSGGGQWMVQGPILLETASQLNLPLSKSIMALAYGDQITNMLQPFWALPLLSITGLKAREILPYTLYFMLIGIVIFIAGLLIF